MMTEIDNEDLEWLISEVDDFYSFIYDEGYSEQINLKESKKRLERIKKVVA